jgi:hypothetical protein
VGRFSSRCRANVFRITQRPDYLDLWHKEFVGRRTSNGKVIDRASAELSNEISERLIRKIDDSGRCYRFPWDVLPDYYLFSSEERAIFVTPCHLPSLESPTALEDRSTLPPVEMFGAVTNDPKVIWQARDVASYYIEKLGCRGAST